MPDTDKKVEPKMVRESDLLAVKRQAEKFKEELAETKLELSNALSKLEVAQVNGEDDEDVKAVKKMLLDEYEALNKDKSEFDKKVASFEERDKESRVGALASKYQLDAKDIAEADDPEKKALELYVERLAKEKEEPPEGSETPAEKVFERAPAGGQVKKSIADINIASEEGRKQLADLEAQFKAEAFNRGKA